ncbi:MAG: site-specific integrase [Rikenellaceae bacterium]
MKLTAFLRQAAKKNTNTSATIFFRLRDGKKDIKAASELTINPNHWSPEKQGYKDRVALVSDEDKRTLNNHIANITDIINKTYTEESDKEWLLETMERYHHPERFKAEVVEAEEVPPASVHDLFLEFLEKHKLSEVRKKNFRVIGRAMQRYELYVRETKRGQKRFKLLVDDVTSDTIRDMWDFFENEYRYFEEYPQIYEHIKEKRIPQKRGHNTLSEIFTRIRTFFLWCYSNKKTTNRPFDDFKIEECRYGTPIYITIEELNKIYNTNLSRHPELAIQRDVFVFQCLIGCRVGDLIKMKKSNLINGAIEYIPRKTKEGRPLTVRVPLNAVAKEIVETYSNLTGDELLPFAIEQKYNLAIKRIFKAAGLKRLVTVINPTTSEEEKRPLYEIAASHMARKTFVGNLYKQVKDPNLVGSLSGHKEGSKAFARYREIDDEMKQELVDLLS